MEFFFPHRAEKGLRTFFVDSHKSNFATVRLRASNYDSRIQQCALRSLILFGAWCKFLILDNDKIWSVCDKTEPTSHSKLSISPARYGTRNTLHRHFRHVALPFLLAFLTSQCNAVYLGCMTVFSNFTALYFNHIRIANITGRKHIIEIKEEFRFRGSCHILFSRDLLKLLALFLNEQRAISLGHRSNLASHCFSHITGLRFFSLICKLYSQLVANVLCISGPHSNYCEKC